MKNISEGLHAVMFVARAARRRLQSYLDHKWHAYCLPALESVLREHPYAWLEKEHNSIDQYNFLMRHSAVWAQYIRQAQTLLKPCKSAAFVQTDAPSGSDSDSLVFSWISMETDYDFALDSDDEAAIADLEGLQGQAHALETLLAKQPDADVAAVEALLAEQTAATAAAVLTVTLPSHVEKYGSFLSINFKNFMHTVLHGTIIADVQPADDMQLDAAEDGCSHAAAPEAGGGGWRSFTMDEAGSAVEDKIPGSVPAAATEDGEQMDVDAAPEAGMDVDAAPEAGSDKMEEDSGAAADAVERMDGDGSAAGRGEMEADDGSGAAAAADDADGSGASEEEEESDGDGGGESDDRTSMLLRHAERLLNHQVKEVTTVASRERVFLRLMDGIENVWDADDDTVLAALEKQYDDNLSHVISDADRVFLSPMETRELTLYGLSFTAATALCDIKLYTNRDPPRIRAGVTERSHPWFKFVQWFIGSQYRAKYAVDPFLHLFDEESRIECGGYTVNFIVPEGLLESEITETEDSPYVTVNCSIPPSEVQYYSIYCTNRYEREDNYERLWRDVDRLELDPTPTRISLPRSQQGAEERDAAYTPIRQIFDIHWSTVQPTEGHRWAHLLRWFIESQFDVPAQDARRAVRPMEHLFTTGIIHGRGYTFCLAKTAAGENNQGEYHVGLRRDSEAADRIAYHIYHPDADMAAHELNSVKEQIDECEYGGVET